MKFFESDDWRDILRFGEPKRTQIKVKVLDVEQYAQGFPDTKNILEFKDWLDEIIQEIPVEYRNSARFELDSTGGYEGSHYAHIEISYWRDETDDEFNARVQRYNDALHQQAIAEKELLSKLKQKYED